MIVNNTAPEPHIINIHLLRRNIIGSKNKDLNRNFNHRNSEETFYSIFKQIQ
jgi:hypothetical protein